MNLKRGLLAVLMLFSMTEIMAQDWDSPEIESMLRAYIKQSFTVEGNVFGADDYEPDPYPLQSANVKITLMGDTTEVVGTSVDRDGYFWNYTSRRDRLKDTRIRVTISYLGMETFDSIYSPKAKRESGIQTFTVKIDSLVLHSNPLTTEEVEIVAELQRMYQRGDTIIFNADAYEMPTGSVLLDLVRRLPGLKYTDGKMTYLGRDINEIRLNGDQFFKRDMSIALNNMPTEKLKSLKVYEVPDDTLNVMSKNHLVMDMETKEPMDQTLFANLQAATTENFDKYTVSVDGSMWNQKGSELWASFSRNTIPFEYSTDLKTDETRGDLYLRKEFSKVSVDASGSYNSTYNETRTDNYNKMFMPEFTQNSQSTNTGYNGNDNWNGSMGVNGRIKSDTWWNLDMNLSRTRSRNGSESYDSIWNEGEGVVSVTRQTSRSENVTDNLSLNGGMNRRFGKDNRYMAYMNFSIGKSGTSGTSQNKSDSRFAMYADSTRSLSHRISTPSDSRNYYASLSLQRQFGDAGYMSVGYNLSYNDGGSIQKYEDVAQDGSLSMVDSLYYDKSNSNLSGSFNVDYYYSDSLYRINLSAYASPVVMTVDNLNRIPGRDDEHIRYRGVRYNANASFRMKVFKRSQLGLTYGGSNGLPDPTQLSMVTDYSDPMNIREGNNSLKNSFSHNVSLEFQFRSIMRTQLSYGTTLNEITTLTRVDRKSGGRITSPANINGSWNVSEYLFLTYPFQDMSLNFTANHSLRHNVAYVQTFTDSQRRQSATDYHRLDLTLEGSYSNRNWLVSSSVGYTQDHSKSDYLDKTNGGKRFTASGNISYQSSIGLGASTTCNYSHPFGYEMASANTPECLWNISAEYRFLKNRQAMLSLTWRDILRSHKGFSASVSGTNWNESRTYSDTSMFVIGFSYRFNDFR